jgi:hypothetical protein
MRCGVLAVCAKTRPMRTLCRAKWKGQDHSFTTKNIFLEGSLSIYGVLAIFGLLDGRRAEHTHAAMEALFDHE